MTHNRCAEQYGKSFQSSLITILASTIVDVVAFRRVLNRIKPIPRSTTDKCSEHNPKIGPLTDLHTRWHSSYFSYKRSSYKNQFWLWRSIFSGIVLTKGCTDINVKWYMKCFIYWTANLKSSKLWSSELWTQFKQLRIEAWKSNFF